MAMAGFVKNTFIHISDASEAELRRSASAPSLTESDGDSEAEEKMLRNHRLGNCKPCSYFYFKPDGCRQGDSCEFCHFCSPEEVKSKKRVGKKEARAQKRAAAMIEKRQSCVQHEALRCQLPLGPRLFRPPRDESSGRSSDSSSS